MKNAPVRKPLVLIVDDNTKNLQLLGTVLREEGYNIAAAMSGAEALAALENLRPDLIMLDVMMPEIDGYMVCQQLKKREQVRDIPVIFITAKTETADVVRGFDHGAVDFIAKPFAPAELRARVRTQLALKKAQDEMRVLNEELRELNEEKNEFLGIVAHDLKNPLTVIVGYASVLRDDLPNLSAPNAELLDRIITTSERMTELIKNLLDVNAIERGQMNLKMTPVDLTAPVAQLVTHYRQLALAKSIIVDYEPPTEPRPVQADEGALVQVLENIISNAIKYSPPQKKVIVRLRQLGGFIQCEVQDQGPGLSADDMKKLFGKFVRLSAKPTGGEHSTGLGLSIVKRLVESMSGKVWCESELGQGANFIVRFPALATPAFTPPPAVLLAPLPVPA